MNSGTLALCHIQTTNSIDSGVANPVVLVKRGTHARRSMRQEGWLKRQRYIAECGESLVPSSLMGGSLVATVPRLRGPTRQSAARKKKSGRFARDDGVWRPQEDWPRKFVGSAEGAHRNQRYREAGRRRHKAAPTTKNAEKGGGGWFRVWRNRRRR
jgi:hypothetical protein